MKSILLYVRTEDRTTGSTSSSDFTIYLPSSLAIQGIKRVCLESAQIPNTVYNVRTSVNDRMCWKRGGTDYNFQIPAGNYDSASLLSAIQTGMNAADANTYVLSLSTTSGKVTVGGSGAFQLNWTSNPQAATSCRAVLGYATGDSASGTSQVATNVINLTRPDALLIKILDSYPIVRSTGTTVDNAHFVIPIDVAPFDLITYDKGQEWNQFYEFASPVTLQQLVVKLFLPGGEAADLNGAEWSMVLRMYM